MATSPLVPGDAPAAAAGPLVSVVVPAYNAEATLAASLASAAAQSYRRIEILIVDDGSTDCTAAVAERFCAAEPRARLIRKANGGASSARNAGIAAASGDYVAPLDADDLWHPAKLERQVAAALAQRRPPGFVYCWFRVIDGDDRVIADSEPHMVEGPALRRLAYRNFVGNGSGPLIHRAAALAAAAMTNPCGGSRTSPSRSPLPAGTMWRQCPNIWSATASMRAASRAIRSGCSTHGRHCSTASSAASSRCRAG
jgi:hypothetical protein